MKVEFPTDLEIARQASLLPMTEVAARMGIGPHLLEPYGHDVAKIKLEAIDELRGRPMAKYVVVSAITPTPLGEGKTTTTVGLGQALSHIGKRSTVAIRQPSMGPTFGIKGGAAGGGYSQIIPMEDFNLHLTGDIHAVTAANNLLAAQIDARMLHERAITDDDKLGRALCPDGTFAPSIAKRAARLGIQATQLSELTKEEKRRLFRLDIDPDSITWQRVMDINDRMLRGIE